MIHLLFRIFGSFAKDYTKHFTFRCKRPEFIMCVFLNMFNHIIHVCHFKTLLSFPGFMIKCWVPSQPRIEQTEDSHKLLSKVIVGLPRLQKLTGRVLYKDLCQSYDGMRNSGHLSYLGNNTSTSNTVQRWVELCCVLHYFNL